MPEGKILLTKFVFYDIITEIEFILNKEDREVNNLQNLHTHSTYGDGKNTLEEIISAAISKGFDSIGFSEHSYMSFSPSYSMSPDETELYKREVSALKQKYASELDIFCGLEVEILSDVDMSGYEYLIGSTHYFFIDGQYVGFDRNEEQVREVIKNYFDGSSMKFAKAYYEQLANLPMYGNFDIIGHFDLVAKHCEREGFLDVNSREYLKYAYDAIDALKGKIQFFEVNTGAIARGYRTSPYPSPPITKRLLESGFLPIISSDCHDMNMLDCAFNDAAELLSACGAKERYILTKDGFMAVPVK